MVVNWKLFEINATAYLNKNVIVPGITFFPCGQSDSWRPDILVRHNGEQLDAIEAKLVPSQAGQFVALKCGEKFQYSDSIGGLPDKYSEYIITHLNKHYADYKNCGTGGIPIKIPSNVSLNWVMEHYKKMGESHIIFSEFPDRFDQNYIRIISLDEMQSCFNASCVIRGKKSGTQKLPIRDRDWMKDQLKKKYSSEFTFIDGVVRFKGGYRPMDLYPTERHFLSKLDDGGYIVKKRSLEGSGDNNPSVIFSLTYTGEKKTAGFSDFRDRLLRKMRC